MYKKITLSIVLVLLAALVMSSTAFAATSPEQTRQVNRLGVITSVGSDRFTILTRGGRTFTVTVDAQTQYQRVSGNTISFRNINVGMRVDCFGTFDKNKVLAAQTVVVMPAQINHHNWVGKRAYGKVVAVFADGFALQTSNGRMTFLVDDNTAFQGNSVRHFGALEAGMHAVVGYTKEPNGKLLALGVAAY